MAESGGRWDGVRSQLGTLADVLSVGSIGVVVLVALVGFVQDQPIIGLAAALGLSLFLNVVLAVAYARNRTKANALATSEESARTSIQALETAVESLADAKEPQPVNAWIGTPRDLATLNISENDLDAALAACGDVARRRLADDAEVRFQSLRLRTFPDDPGTPEVWIDACSEAAGREALLVYSGLTQKATINHVGRTEAPDFLSDVAAPWRHDSSWSRLVSLSWARMRPFTGDAALYFTRSQGCWTIDYRPREHGELLPAVTYRLDENGALVKVD